MPEKILNMDWEELLDLIQAIRADLKRVRDDAEAACFILEWAETLGVEKKPW